MDEIRPLRRAAGNAPTFPDRDVTGVPIPDGDAGARPAALALLVERYEAHGFALACLGGTAWSADDLVGVAAALGLGEPFVPPLYRVGGRQAPTIARISAAGNADTEAAEHPSFGKTNGQRMHTDGTLQDIGQVCSSMLLCSEPAAEGGVTVLFNATGAYADLLATDEAAALALAAPGVLVRQANINGSTEANRGPAFAVRDGELVTRYAITDTDRWAVPPGMPADALWRGVRFMERAGQPGSPYYLELRLAAGQLILLANSRICHGRTAYRDSATQRRCMYRSLHLRKPRVPHPVAVTGAGQSQQKRS